MGRGTRLPWYGMVWNGMVWYVAWYVVASWYGTMVCAAACGPCSALCLIYNKFCRIVSQI